MKQIFLLFALVLGLITTNAQNWNNVSGRYSYNHLRGDSSLFIPSGPTAPSGIASLRNAKWTAQSAFYADTAHKRLYMFHPHDSSWTELAGSFDTNFGNTDIRFTGDRAHSAAGHSLVIDSAKKTELITRGVSFSNTKKIMSMKMDASNPFTDAGDFQTFGVTYRNAADNTDSAAYRVFFNTAGAFLEAVNGAKYTRVQTSSVGSLVLQASDSVMMGKLPIATSADTILAVRTFNPFGKYNTLVKVPLSGLHVTASAAGSSQNIQYNLGGSFAASSQFNWEPLNSQMSILSDYGTSILGGGNLYLQSADGSTAPEMILVNDVTQQLHVGVQSSCCGNAGYLTGDGIPVEVNGSDVKLLGDSVGFYSPYIGLYNSTGDIRFSNHPWATPYATWKNGGRLLIGQTTDDGNGKLQITASLGDFQKAMSLNVSGNSSFANPVGLSITETSTDGGYGAQVSSSNGYGLTASGKNAGLIGTVLTNAQNVYQAAGVNGATYDNTTAPGLLAQVYGTTTSQNTVLPAIDIRREVRAFTNTGGGGVAIRTFLPVYDPVGVATNNPILANTIQSVLTNISGPNYTTDLLFTGPKDSVYNTILTLKGGGQLQGNQYTGSNFETVDTSFPAAVFGTDGKIYKRHGSGGIGSVKAISGLSVNADTVKLGQSIGAAGNPARLLANREIPADGFTIAIKDTGSNHNKLTLGSGTFVVSDTNTTSPFSINNVYTNGGGGNPIVQATTVNFSTGINTSSLSGNHISLITHNTKNGSVISTSASNRHATIFGLQTFENDTAAVTNNITISGTNSVDGIFMKFDMWPGAGGQHKNISGKLIAYDNTIDLRSAAGTLSEYTDYMAGNILPHATAAFTIGTRRALEIRPLDSMGNVINKYAIDQRGTNDTNYFAGPVRLPNAATTNDTTTYKPIVYDAAGNIRKMIGWPSGGGSTPNLEAVLTAGATLTNPHTWAFGSNTQTITTSQSTGTGVSISNTGNGTTASFGANGTGPNVIMNNTGSGDGLFSSTLAGIAGRFSSGSGITIYGSQSPASANTATTTFMTGREYGGTTSAGVGNSWDQQIQDAGGTDRTAASYRSVLTTATGGAASAEIQFYSITGGSLTKKFTIKPTGLINWDGYGSGSQTGTPAYDLAVTSGGDVVEKTPKVKYVQTADASVVANDNELTLISSGTGSLTIPANTMQAGKSYRLTVRGKYSTDASNPAQMNWRSYFGSTAVLNPGNAGLGTGKTDKGFEIKADFTCRSTGSSGSVMAQGMFFTEDGPGAKNFPATTTTTNTTVSQTFNFTVDLTDGSAGNSCYVYILIFEEI